MESQPSDLWLEADTAGGIVIARFIEPWLVGDATSRVIGERLQALLKQAAGRPVLLDLGRVEYLGSSMLGQLATVHQRATAAGLRLALCGPQPAVRQALAMTGLTRVFTIYADVEEAMRAHQNP